MIYSISGVISHIFDTKVIIQNQQSSLGFEVICPQTKTFTLQDTVTLYTHLHWSPEQGPSLYGFIQRIEKEVFLLLIGCSGIGPKLAITVLENISASDLLNVIHQENVASISSIKGIGTKKAEQLILQLKDKAPKIMQQHPTTAIPAISTWIDLQQTLTSLNYSPLEIKQTTSILKEQTIGQTVTFELLLRKALLLLAKK